MQNTNKGKCGPEKPWSISVPVRPPKGQCLWRGKHCYSNELLKSQSLPPAQSVSRVSNNSHQQRLLPQQQQQQQQRRRRRQQQPAGVGNRDFVCFLRGVNGCLHLKGLCNVTLWKRRQKSSSETTECLPIHTASYNKWPFTGKWLLCFTCCNIN